MKKMSILCSLFFSYCSIISAMDRQDSQDMQQLGSDFDRTMRISEARNVLDYSNKSITDDAVSACMPSTQVLTVSGLLEIMTRKDPATIEQIDVSNNVICIDGATQLLIYIAAHVKNLKTLNLAYNNIKGKRLAFTDALIAVLKMKSLIALDLTGAISRYRYGKLKSKLASELFHKIIWKKD